MNLHYLLFREFSVCLKVFEVLTNECFTILYVSDPMSMIAVIRNYVVCYCTHGRRSVGDGGTPPPTFQGGDSIGIVPPHISVEKIARHIA